MKFSINQSLLSESISIVQRAISSRALTQELEGVLLTLEDNRLKLTGTDSEIISIETFVDCISREDGKALVNARLFGDIIRKLPNETVHIDVVGERMHIKCMNSNFELLIHNPMDYPNLPKVNDDNSITIDKQILKNAIKQTSFAVSLDYNRRTLTGVLFEVSEESIKFVSLDGYRLSVVTEDINFDMNIQSIVPGKALNELYRILDDEESDVKISFTRNNIVFELDDTLFYSQVIDGQYFSYRDIIRDNHASTVRINRNSFRQSLERAGLLAKEEKANLIKLEIEDSTCRILSNTELGSVEESIPVEIEGSDQVIAFNSRYLLEGIRNMEDEEIELKLLDDVNPMIIEGVDNPNYLYLVLPVRLA